MARTGPSLFGRNNGITVIRTSRLCPKRLQRLGNQKSEVAGSHTRNRRDLPINYPNCILAVCRNLQVQIIRVTRPEKQGCPNIRAISDNQCRKESETVQFG